MILKLLECDVPLEVTGRIYPKALVEKALKRFHIENENYFIPGVTRSKGAWYQHYDEVLLSRATHVITEIGWAANVLYGKVTILKDSIKELLKEVNELTIVGNGLTDDNEVVTELEIISFDLLW